MARRYTNGPYRNDAPCASITNKIARPHILCRPGNQVHPCRLPAFPLCILPRMGAGHAPCTRPYIRHENPSRVWNHLQVEPRHSLVAASVRASSLRLSGQPRRPAAATIDGRPACRDQSPCNPLRQRLGTGAGTSCLDGAAVGACLVPTVIRCRFRSTVAVPIPFTRVRSSTRRKGPCWCRYATIAWALTGPTFVNPCSSATASAVLMLIRSAVQAAPLSNNPSTSALHDLQSPTV